MNLYNTNDNHFLILINIIVYIIRLILFLKKPHIIPINLKTKIKTYYKETFHYIFRYI